jgi:hypothetical protein
MERKLFGWDVTIADAETNDVEVVEVFSFWSPGREETVGDIAMAGAAYESVKRRRKMLPISAVQHEKAEARIG